MNDTITTKTETEPVNLTKSERYAVARLMQDKASDLASESHRLFKCGHLQMADDMANRAATLKCIAYKAQRAGRVEWKETPARSEKSKTVEIPVGAVADLLAALSLAQQSQLTYVMTAERDGCTQAAKYGKQRADEFGKLRETLVDSYLKVESLPF